MIAARKGSPLAIGHGEGEMFVGSDAIALAPLTDRITYLEEGDWAVVTRGRRHDPRPRGAPRQPRPSGPSPPTRARPTKGGHRHFMAKEIAEQPARLTDALAHYLDGGGDPPARARHRLGRHRPAVDGRLRHRLLRDAGRQVLVRAGRGPALRRRRGLRVPLPRAARPARTAALFVSQSGETADTLAALRYCQGRADRDPRGRQRRREQHRPRERPRAADPRRAARSASPRPRPSPASSWSSRSSRSTPPARGAGSTPRRCAAHLARPAARCPGLVNHALGADEAAHRHRRPARRGARHPLPRPRAGCIPLALEGALKLKEISYIHAEAYASGELKHGPIALVDKTVPVIVMAPHDELFDKTVSNMQEVMARGGQVLLVTDREGARVAAEGVWETLVMPDVAPLWAPILYAVPAQLLAYHTAIAKGTDVDQPRNLAKSVTVE